MVLVFDLDDTLYDEITYVHSGFAAVAAFAAREWGVRQRAFERALVETEARRGRGRVFDVVLASAGVQDLSAVRRCLAVYRGHVPHIRLHAAGRRALARFRHVPTYIVTDGNALVQERKVRALGLTGRVRKALVTHRYGRHHAKPSPYCFQRIAAWEGEPASRIVYVGDNPTKDFVGIRPLGFRTVRVRTGAHAAVRVPRSQDAEVTIDSLDALTWDLLARW